MKKKLAKIPAEPVCSLRKRGYARRVLFSARLQKRYGDIAAEMIDELTSRVPTRRPVRLFWANDDMVLDVALYSTREHWEGVLQRSRALFADHGFKHVLLHHWSCDDAHCACVVQNVQGDVYNAKANR